MSGGTLKPLGSPAQSENPSAAFSLPPLFHGRALAAPSWVMPGSIDENCRFLSGKVHEVGLLFFDTKTSMDYGPEELPDSLAALPLSYHAHLPSDLPGTDGCRDAETCCLLMNKIAHLAVRRAVLHLPADNAAAYLERFVRRWSEAGYAPCDLLLENTRQQNLLGMTEAIADNGASVCLDTGHMLAYGQEALVSCPSLVERTRLVHLNAPGKREKKSHLPLTYLTASGHILCENLIRVVPDDAVLMLELFDWNMIATSLPLLERWLTKKYIFPAM